MRAKAIVVFLAATAIVGVLAIPACASAAKPHQAKQKPTVTAELKMRGTHGFRVDLFTLGTGPILLIASRSSREGEVSVSYFSLIPHPDAFDPDELNIRVGPLGHFRGRFVPTSTETKKPFAGCKGDPTTIEKGFFVGSFNFHGERGYTVIHSHREPGNVTHQPPQTCSISGPRWHESHREIKETKERERTEFRLVAGDEHANVLLRASREESGIKGPASPETTFQVSVNGARTGDFQVSYSAFDFGLRPDAASRFQTPNLAEPLAEVTLAPPAPFIGSATFHLDDPKTGTWTGDLAVELPGAGKVPLTGAGINAGVCKGPSKCTETLPKNLQPILEAPSDAIVAISVAKPHS